MKTTIMFVLVLSATCLHAQPTSEGIRIKLDVQHTSEPFCVRNDGYLFIFDRQEFFGNTTENQEFGTTIPYGDTVDLHNRNENSFGDDLSWSQRLIAQRMNTLLESGRAEVYTPDGRVLRALDLVSVRGNHQWYCLPGSQTRVFSFYPRFLSGCPSF